MLWRERRPGMSQLGNPPELAAVVAVERAVVVGASKTPSPQGAAPLLLADPSPAPSGFVLPAEELASHLL